MVIECGECDFVSDIVGEMFLFVIVEMMGLLFEDGCELYWLIEIFYMLLDVFVLGESDVVFGKMFGYVVDVIKEKWVWLVDDLVLKLLVVEVDGCKFDDVEF